MDAKQVEPNIDLDKMPIFQLNLGERFYLAVSKQTVNKLVFVYTLGCQKQQNTGKYNGLADIQVATFQDADKAEIYYNTVYQSIEFVKTSQVYKSLIDYNSPLLKAFEKNSKGK